MIELDSYKGKPINQLDEYELREALKVMGHQLQEQIKESDRLWQTLNNRTTKTTSLLKSLIGL